jgi:hypothetical protein
MKENWELLALAAGALVYFAHDILHSGLHQEIPIEGEMMSVGAGLALLAIVGIGVNAYYYAEQDA